MLVTFSSHAYENITMFGDVALRMLKMMGQSGLIPGAILADDVPAALQQLQERLSRVKNPDAPVTNDDDEPEVSLKHRALPLIQLLEASIEKHCDVLWSSN